jgi:hypothetical protein
MLRFTGGNTNRGTTLELHDLDGALQFVITHARNRADHILTHRQVEILYNELTEYIEHYSDREIEEPDVDGSLLD